MRAVRRMCIGALVHVVGPVGADQTSERALCHIAKCCLQVTYDLEKAGTRGICHSNGFAVPVCWCKVTDRRNGPLQAHLGKVHVVEAAVQVVEERDVAPAEAALQAFAGKLEPMLQLGPAH